MIMYKLVFSEDFDYTIKLILQFSVETFGESIADEYFMKIDIALTKLSNMPSIGHKRNDIPSDTLAFNVEKHVIIYEIKEAEKTVHILRILHSRMNFRSKF